MKRLLRYYLGDLFLPRRFYALAGVLSLCFLVRYFVPGIGTLPFVMLVAAATVTAVDYWLLFLTRGTISAARACPERLSNGDDNEVAITLESRYGFSVRVTVLDEIPAQFQKRDLSFSVRLSPGGAGRLRYGLRPTRRGSYQFGRLRLYAASPLGWLQRRFIAGEEQTVRVYPSFLRLRKYHLMAEASRREPGLRRKRLLGHSMEFEQIKAYVPGDDYRTLNWKATARTGSWMVNSYVEQRSQQVYCIIDKGRAMKMPFEGLSLLDYAINATLVISSVAERGQDKVGVITFSNRVDTLLVAERTEARMRQILEALYHQKTGYPESDYERLYIAVRNHIPQRSLLILFTNFETLSALKRQEPYLRKMATRHRVVVVIFENTEIAALVKEGASGVAEVYTEVVSEKFSHDKRLIIRELQLWGIAAILSAPATVTVDALNKYLELKARQAL